MAGGRPTKYNVKLANHICELRSGGKSLRAICRSSTMPHRATVRRWLLKYNKFCTRYVEAADIDADNVFSDLIWLADKCKNPSQAALLKIQIDTRKWVLARRRPKKYGERVEQILSGPKGGPIQSNMTMTFVKPGDVDK